MRDPTHPVVVEDLLAHRAWLRALARSLVRDDSAADDLVQDTWIAALRSPPDDPAASKSWLRRVATNLARDRHRTTTRRTARETAASRVDRTEPTLDVVARAETQRRLTNHVLALDEPYRTAILLRFFDGLAPRDVAERTRAPVETVRTRVRRGLDRLRARLDADHAGRREAWLGALVVLADGTPDMAATADAANATTSSWQAVATVRPWTVVLVALSAGLAISVALFATMGSDPNPEPDVATSPADGATSDGGRRRVARTPDAAPPPSAEEEERPVEAPPVRPRPPFRAASGPVLPGTVLLPGSPEQPMGMDEAELRAALTGPLGYDLDAWERFPFVWEHGFLFATPRHTRPMASVAMARHEVTNAQWKVFLDAPINQDVGTTSPGMTLIKLARFIYGIQEESGPQVQRAWLYLWELNREVLEPVLNARDRADFDPLAAQAGQEALPGELELRFSTLLPPPYWKGGMPPEDELDRPVRFISWAEAQAFCRWAGVHLPLEVEWERAARGAEAERLFPWGNAWDADAAVWSAAPRVADGRPGPVDSHARGATPEGIHHLAGNVSEFVHNIARPYPGSSVDFRHSGVSVLARGGNYEDRSFAMLSADRIWDLGGQQIEPDSRASGYGFRWAAYGDAGRELGLDLATYGTNRRSSSGPYLWLPVPPGLTRQEALISSRRAAFEGFAIERAAGWLERDVVAGAGSHAVVAGPAKGIALIPVKGVNERAFRNQRRASKLMEGSFFLGALVSTTNARVITEGVGNSRNAIEVGHGPDYHVEHDLGFRYQIGAWLVLSADGVAVYPGQGSAAGVQGAHLRREPRGRIPQEWIESLQWVDTRDARAQAERTDDAVTLTVPIPQLDRRTGDVLADGKSALVTITIPVEFTAD